jgi:hypothetical protein
MKRYLRPEWVVVAILVAVCFGAVLLIPAGLVFSGPFTDLAAQFAAWRAFAAASLLAGHFPLWNPYTFSGEPFLGGFQSALFYPPNAIFLFLPLSQALNLSMLLHLVILGWGMYRWAIQRGFSPLAATLCGLALPLSGPVFPHIYAGHLSNLCTMAWAPWIMGGLESWWKDGRRAGFFEASAAICLQILAGHVQYVFFTGVAAGVNALVWSAEDRSVLRRALPIVAACYAAAAALAAAQLLPGLAATAESVRQGKISFGLASTFFLPVENLLSLFIPNFLEYPAHIYWGRWYGFELSLFIGASGVLLAGVGAIASEARRAVWRDLAATALLVILALGYETPLYRILYDYVPGIGQFRGMSKFAFPAMLFIVLAIGAGIDVLVRRRPIRRLIPAAALGAGAMVGAAGLYLWNDASPVIELARWARDTGANQLPDLAFKDLRYLQGAAKHVGTTFVLAGAIFLLIGASLAAVRRWPILRWVALVVFPVEMIAYACNNFELSPLFVAQTIPADMRDFIKKNPGDYRILDLINPQNGADNGFIVGAPDIWGNDPLVSRRYAEFITATQGYNPDNASQDIAEFKYVPRIYAMLRCRYVIRVANDRPGVYEGAPDPLPQALLVSNYRVLHGRNNLFTAMSAQDFDPRRTVLLESEPDPSPVPSPYPGTLRIANVSSDEIMVEADVATPTILLVTDPYSRDWRAVPLEGSSQQSYTILPANYILRAIPLAAGHHHLMIEYAPASFPIGVGISVASLLLWMGAAVGLRIRDRRRAAAV